jgi:hypothetical protein
LKFREKYFSTNIIKVVKNLFNGDWGLGIGDWGLGPIPNPQSPETEDLIVKAKYAMFGKALVR